MQVIDIITLIIIPAIILLVIGCSIMQCLQKRRKQIDLEKYQVKLDRNESNNGRRSFMGKLNRSISLKKNQRSSPSNLPQPPKLHGNTLSHHVINTPGYKQPNPNASPAKSTLKKPKNLQQIPEIPKIPDMQDVPVTPPLNTKKRKTDMNPKHKSKHDIRHKPRNESMHPRNKPPAETLQSSNPPTPPSLPDTPKYEAKISESPRKEKSNHSRKSSKESISNHSRKSSKESIHKSNEPNSITKHFKDSQIAKKLASKIISKDSLPSFLFKKDSLPAPPNIPSMNRKGSAPCLSIRKNSNTFTALDLLPHRSFRTSISEVPQIELFTKQPKNSRVQSFYFQDAPNVTKKASRVHLKQEITPEINYQLNIAPKLPNKDYGMEIKQQLPSTTTHDVMLANSYNQTRLPQIGDDIYDIEDDDFVNSALSSLESMKL
eukprot:NODE_394_length_8135_cov_0.672847.p1 type:complete len:432 gc:universal NODE_394_length_8135_cov_0.672847:2943-4238(+)